MVEEQQVFLVIRCTSCERHFGSLRNNKSFVCPGCGESGEYPIVERAKDSGDLRKRVSFANVPPELRDEMKRKIKVDDYQDYQEDSASAPSLLKLLRNLVDEEGKVNISTVQNELDRRGIALPDAQELIDMAESQGLLLRDTPTEWKLLE
jgi:predicted RNA-binding Zn-ribbon protein involved in translation (DUF1610 family)